MERGEAAVFSEARLASLTRSLWSFPRSVERLQVPAADRRRPVHGHRAPVLPHRVLQLALVL